MRNPVKYVVQRGFIWLVNALDLGDAQTPFELSSTVRPTLDVDQRGWGHRLTATETTTWQVGASTSAATYDLATGRAATDVPGDPSLQFVVHTLDIVNNALNPGDVIVQFAPPGGLPSRVRATSIPADEGGAAGTNAAAVRYGHELLPGGRPLWVPPGHRPQLAIQFDTGSSDSIDVTATITTMRAGFSGGAP